MAFVDLGITASSRFGLVACNSENDSLTMFKLPQFVLEGSIFAQMETQSQPGFFPSPWSLGTVQYNLGQAGHLLLAD